MGKLDGKVALVTGASTGIGLATAKLFQHEGARVVITGRTQATLEAAKKELGPNAIAIQSDTSKLPEIDKLIKQIKAEVGRIDVLFANAGIAKFATFEQSNEAFFDEQFNTNVKGLYFLVQGALNLIPDGGAIVLNASVVSKKAFPMSSVYAATKAAVRSFGRTLAAELVPRRIRVNTVSPGPIETPIFEKTGMPAEAMAEWKKNTEQGVGLKRFGQPEEVAKAVLFLASDDSSFVVGTELFTDGGLAEF